MFHKMNFIVGLIYDYVVEVGREDKIPNLYEWMSQQDTGIVAGNRIGMHCKEVEGFSL